MPAQGADGPPPPAHARHRDRDGALRAHRARVAVLHPKPARSTSARSRGTRCSTASRCRAALDPAAPGRLAQDGAWLPRDVLLQGIPCKGTGYKGWAMRYHPGGRLALCYLSRETTIDGVRCRAGAFLTELSGSTQVTLHPNGRLVRCRPRR